MIRIHGHRGCRGWLPENTVTGFMAAVEMGADALELDLVISQDNQVVVSHEPWMSHLICLAPDGSRITVQEEQQHNLYRMPYSQIRRYDCGSLVHPDFRQQRPAPAHKPLLSEVVQAIEAMPAAATQPVLYNLELKSNSGSDGLFHPPPAQFAMLVLQAIAALPVSANRWLLQSFDNRILEQLHRFAPQYELGCLAEEEDPMQKLAHLSFTPAYLNPQHLMVTAQQMEQCRQRGIKVAPWTVNEKAEMHRLLELGVAGLITDFPDRASEVLLERGEAEVGLA